MAENCTNERVLPPTLPPTVQITDKNGEEKIVCTFCMHSLLILTLPKFQKSSGRTIFKSVFGMFGNLCRYLKVSVWLRQV
jgi:hypothetical protein